MAAYSVLPDAGMDSDRLTETLSEWRQENKLAQQAVLVERKGLRVSLVIVNQTVITVSSIHCLEAAEKSL